MYLLCSHLLEIVSCLTTVKDIKVSEQWLGRIMNISTGADHCNYHSLVPSSAHSPNIGHFPSTSASMPSLFMYKYVHRTHYHSLRWYYPTSHLKNTLFSFRLRGVFVYRSSFISLSFPDPLIVIVNAYCVIERAYLNWLLCYQPCLISSFVLSIVR